MSAMRLDWYSPYDSPVSSARLINGWFVICDTFHLKLTPPWHFWSIAKFCTIHELHNLLYLGSKPPWRTILRHIACTQLSSTDSFLSFLFICIIAGIPFITTSDHSSYPICLPLHFHFMERRSSNMTLILMKSTMPSHGLEMCSYHNWHLFLFLFALLQMLSPQWPKNIPIT